MNVHKWYIGCLAKKEPPPPPLHPPPSWGGSRLGKRSINALFTS